jgi:hypothetical protein
MENSFKRIPVKINIGEYAKWFYQQPNMTVFLIATNNGVAYDEYVDSDGTERYCVEFQQIGIINANIPKQFVTIIDNPPHLGDSRPARPYDN